MNFVGLTRHFGVPVRGQRHKHQRRQDLRLVGLLPGNKSYVLLNDKQLAGRTVQAAIARLVKAKVVTRIEQPITIHDWNALTGLDSYFTAKRVPRKGLLDQYFRIEDPETLLAAVPGFTAGPGHFLADRGKLKFNLPQPTADTAFRDFIAAALKKVSPGGAGSDDPSAGST